MELKDLRRLFSRARELSGHSEFVVVGSNSVLGVMDHESIPARMTQSNDVDAYTKSDPARVFDLGRELGQGSAFEMEYGFYLDPISPALPTLPDGWKDRLFRTDLDDGLVVYFLDPNDAAVSKYARGEPRDREWLQAGLGSGLLSPQLIEYRMRETVFESDDERRRALGAFDRDKRRFGISKAGRSKR